MTSPRKSAHGTSNVENVDSTCPMKSPDLRISAHNNNMEAASTSRLKVSDNLNPIGTTRKLSPRRKLKMAIQSGTKALGVKTDLFYSTSMASMVSPATRIKRQHYRREWHHRHRSSSTTLSKKEKCSFAFKARTFVCLQIPNKDGPSGIVFLRIGPSGQLLMVPYPMELTDESAMTDPVHSYYAADEDETAAIQEKQKRLQNVLKELDKLGPSMWIPVGNVKDVNNNDIESHTIETEHENRKYMFKMKTCEQKKELYNRVRFEMQLLQRQQVLAEPIGPTAHVDIELVINDIHKQIQTQQATLDAIQRKIMHNMKDISTYADKLKLIDSKVSAVEDSMERSWQVMVIKSKLDHCKYNCNTLVRQLRSIHASMDRREEKISRYSSWMEGMQLRVDLIKLAGPKAEMWKSRWKWISFLVFTIAIWFAFGDLRHQLKG